MIRNLIISFLLLLSGTLKVDAQNLNGTWEGILDNDERLQVFIQMRDQELCGYTSDYVIRRPSSYCKANFRGWYDEEEDAWVLVGTSFIENSGDHILMILRFWHQKGDPENVLRGTEEAKYGSSSIFSSRNRSPVRIKRISRDLPDDMPDCFPRIVKPNKIEKEKQKEVTVIKPKEVTVVPKEKKVIPPAKTTAPPVKQQPVVKTKPVIKENAIPVKKTPVLVTTTDTVKKITPVVTAPNPVIVDPDLIKKMLERKKTEFSHLVVNDKNITLSLYDNGIVDNDTVSVFYNKKLIAGKKRLSEKPIVIHLELDESAPLHEIVLFAENLGTIPPNTALVVVTAGSKRYELHSSASLTENAVLTFEYIPKQN